MGGSVDGPCTEPLRLTNGYYNVTVDLMTPPALLQQLEAGVSEQAGKTVQTRINKIVALCVGAALIDRASSRLVAASIFQTCSSCNSDRYNTSSVAPRFIRRFLPAVVNMHAV